MDPQMGTLTAVPRAEWKEWRTVEQSADQKAPPLEVQMD
jgi:hypothetical protein